MKQITILLILILMNCSNLFADGFNSVHSKDGITVWAAGNNGSIFYSSNGGQNWINSLVGSYTHNSVFATNSKVFIVGNSGSIRVSENNGGYWSFIPKGNRNLNSVHFVDDNLGWTVGDAGSIYKTTDAGATWDTQTSPVTENLNSIKMQSPTSGVACGNNGKVIYWDGNSWNLYTTSVTNNLLSIDRKNNTIIATAEDGIIIKSTNSGLNWITIDYKSEVKPNITSVFMFDENTFYSCGGGGFIRKSIDGGDNFTFQENPMMGNLVDIYFYNSNQGWAVSSLNNAVLRTTNGGNTWSLPDGTTVNYTWTNKQAGSSNIGNGFCLHPFNKNAIFIAMGNKVYRSYDRGETWSQFSTITPGSRAHTFFVSSVDTNYMLASMDESAGKVLRSSNYGANWTVVWNGALTSYGMPMIADQTTPNQVYLNPDNSVLLKSTNWGLNWTNVGTKVFRSPDNLTVAWNDPNVIFSGDGVTGSGVAELFKTTNGGLNWSLVHSVSGSEIPFTVVSKLDQNLSYHSCWSSGGIWKSTNHWTTFSQVAGTGNAWAVDIAKDDPTVVGYGVYGSAVYYSTNSGVSFTSSNVGSSPEAGMYFYDRGTLLSQKGGGVYKMKITYNVPFITSVSNLSNEIPEKFLLSQNYPNPFNPDTKIKFDIPSVSGKQNYFVSIKVYDAAGKQVSTLIEQSLLPGVYETTWNAGGNSSGVYFYSLMIDGKEMDIKKMILIK
ncbi:MAG: Ycf48-like protein [Ignavibacteria bacterium]|nr:Ycf48-like protein [Ignavibacteria bacterium]